MAFKVKRKPTGAKVRGKTKEKDTKHGETIAMSWTKETKNTDRYDAVDEDAFIREVYLVKDKDIDEPVVLSLVKETKGTFCYRTDDEDAFTKMVYARKDDSGRILAMAKAPKRIELALSKKGRKQIQLAVSPA